MPYDSDRTNCKDSSQLLPQESQPEQASQQQKKTGEIKVEPFNDKEIKDITIIVHYEDPGIQQALKELLYKAENKKLLLKFEQSVPSWTVVMAQYTAVYSPWMRHAVRIICF